MKEEMGNLAGGTSLYTTGATLAQLHPYFRKDTQINV